MMKDRYEQEIEQILNELDAEIPDGSGGGPHPVSPVPPLDDRPSPFAPQPRPRMRLISPVKLALLGLIVVVIGLILFHQPMLALAGVGIVALALVWMFIQRISSQPQQMWRGRPVDPPPPQSTWERFRRWLAK